MTPEQPLSEVAPVVAMKQDSLPDTGQSAMFITLDTFVPLQLNELGL